MTFAPEPPRGLRNPILPGFNPDPSIARRGDDYYIATSTFEWLPAVQLHHSTDLAHWELVGHAITDRRIDLRGIHPSGGVWAPCLSVDPEDGRFYLVFSIMKSQTVDVFDVDNFVIWADEITGPWSEPLYVNSVGFDSSLFHDDDGSKWLVTLEWETRPGYQHPGSIVAQRFDPATGEVGAPVRIHQGTSDRGALEAPHLYKRDGRYYLMTAEGGTGYGHSVCLARAERVCGPYESDPIGPFLTSAPQPYFGRDYRDFLRPEFFNPDAPMQKAGHGSLVESTDGRWWVAHLSSRPLPGTTSCVLGRETSLQEVRWNDDGWLRMTTPGPMPQEYVDLPGEDISTSDLDVEMGAAGALSPHFASLRAPIDPSWCVSAPEGLRVRGRDSLHSRFDVSLVATRLRAFTAVAETTFEAAPVRYSQAAGMTLFYDDRNFLFARVSWSEQYESRTIALVRARTVDEFDEVLVEQPIPDGPVTVRLQVDQGLATFAWRPEAGAWHDLGGSVDSQFMSDDVIRGFTGQFIGMAVVDALGKSLEATFTDFAVRYPAAEVRDAADDRRLPTHTTP
ncbi:glycoside hydrolase family 43 protein [Microbacterium aquimaris]|uniref:Glycoside hydrolase family 43 protein n=1 Tax=Microbacterium aquimaris TaxID=459816 RepID=A0ABU5N3I5_9MICO|nr:glycoside hydrolase family 43 protein [Microbacterium aquimaris]MDZ8160651.1 glycoside hydrolase family 43 protein [Microbacterium aquimaris]